jgi:hypothetical protein
MPKLGAPHRPVNDVVHITRSMRLTRGDVARLDELARMTHLTPAEVVRNLIRSAELTGQYPVRGSCLPPGAEERSGE